MDDFDGYRFSKQFLITEEDPDSLRDMPYLSRWQTLGFGGNLFVFHHPDLAVSHAAGEQSEVLCLGEWLDPDRPEATNDDIAHALATEVTDFDRLEARLARLAGRWVLLARFGNSTFLYNDAGGLKTAFLYKDPARDMACVASQPALFEHAFSLRRQSARDAEMKRVGAEQWPVYVYPYDNIVQILPNHRLNMASYTIERYWPKGPLPTLDVDEAAGEILACVRAVVRAAVNRRQCYISLTAGYDSRLLLAATLELQSEIRYFTLKYDSIPRFDVVIPRRLARMFRLHHRFVPVTPAQPELLDILTVNSAGLFPHVSCQEIGTLAKVVNGGFYLQGLLGEPMRCFFYLNGIHPEVTPDELCRRTEFADSPIAKQGFARWLNALPDTNIKPLDLFYWEQRLGAWCSAGTTFREALVETVPPMNCRYVVERGLSVDVKHRMRPHNLFRRVYALADERLLKLGLNTTRLDDFVDHLGGLDRVPLLWRIKPTLRPKHYGGRQHWERT